MKNTIENFEINLTCINEVNILTYLYVMIYV